MQKFYSLSNICWIRYFPAFLHCSSTKWQNLRSPQEFVSWRPWTLWYFLSVCHYDHVTEPGQRNPHKKQVRQLTRLAYIPTCRHRPCGGQFFTPHTVRGCPASFTHRANKRRTCYRFFNFWPWGLPLGQRSQKWEMTYYPPRSTILQNLISARSRKRSTRYALPKFFTFWLRGLTPGPKFTKRGDDLVDSEIYHPAKFHHSMSTHARDIR